ncbi:hypothetical protein ALNOE001_02490 [Candidatus Methanobinarius endosymbioticus]|uniref:Uncharacterized protein n=1 Tax=Candidatus Methanobinarius endosymbioticus TaxID=2006182 RepID=A0A366MFP7_9EURY|nr:hypothetical protein ALNOE001_02490 [Candidatus Methanobinarius endosymbioticus]
MIISISVFGFISSDLENQKIVEENIHGRILVDDIANTINQVNSNIGHFQEIEIPNNISGKYFVINIKQNEVILSFGGKKTESTIFSIQMISIEENHIADIKLYPSEKYI